MRDLTPLFAPRSVAIVGASNDPAKWGQWLARGALTGEHRRSVYLVNRSGGEVLGRRAYRSVDELPEPPELVVIAVAASAFEDVVERSLAAGSRAIVAISSGLGETGEAGRARERAVVEHVRAAGAILLGPNCLGVYDAEAELDLGANSELVPGPIGLVSQSGNLALELALLARDAGLGFSRFASLGNQADLEAADLIAALATHESTRVIAVYVEDFRDGRAFARAAQAAVRGGKPVVLLAAGSSEASARAAHSHTGALVSDLAAVDAACRAAGVTRVDTPRELVDVARLVLGPSLPRGRRLAIVGDGGGHGIVAADVAAAAGLEVPALSTSLQAELAAGLPATASTVNPVDFAGGGEQDFGTYERVPRLVLGSGEVDAVVLTGYFGGYSETSAELQATEVATARAMASGALTTGRPLVVHTMYPSSPSAEELRSAGTPVYREIEAAIRAIARVVDGVGSERAIPEPGVPAAALGESGYLRARDELAAMGIPFPPARRVTDWPEAAAAAEELGYPVVLKALGLLHKSDAGGVALGLADEASLESAFAQMTTVLSPEACVIEPMESVAAAAELIIGCRRDPRFGPLLLVGLGGVYAELLRDVAVALAPVDREEAEELIRRLRGAPLLLGLRGRPPLDVSAAAAAAAALSRFAASHPEVAEVEVNPLLVRTEGVVGLDARIVLA